MNCNSLQPQDSEQKDYGELHTRLINYEVIVLIWWRSSVIEDLGRLECSRVIFSQESLHTAISCSGLVRPSLHPVQRTNSGLSSRLTIPSTTAPTQSSTEDTQAYDRHLGDMISSCNASFLLLGGLEEVLLTSRIVNRRRSRYRKITEPSSLPANECYLKAGHMVTDKLWRVPLHHVCHVLRPDCVAVRQFEDAT